jgi:hypothetical protein
VFRRRLGHQAAKNKTVRRVQNRARIASRGLRIAKAAPTDPKYGAEGMPHGTVDNPLVFPAVGYDGWVTIVVHRSEMGRGESSTTLDSSAPRP